MMLGEEIEIVKVNVRNGSLRLHFSARYPRSSERRLMIFFSLATCGRDSFGEINVRYNLNSSMYRSDYSNRVFRVINSVTVCPA